MKKIICSSIIVFILILLVGCFSAKSQNFTNEQQGYEITLTNKFKEVKLTDGYEDKYVGAYESRDVAIFIAKDLKSDMDNVYGDLTLNEYAEIIKEINGLNKTYESRENYVYLSYDKTIEGQDYHYIVALYKYNNAYWTVNYACFASKKTKFLNDILDYADSFKEITI